MKKTKNTKRADGYFQVSVYIGNDENNKRKYKVFYGNTQKDAEEKARQFKDEMKKSINYTESYDTFEKWAGKWYSFITIHGNKAGQDIGHSQLKNYEGYLKGLNSFIGKMPLNKITVDDIQNVIDSYFEENPHTGRPTAKKTLNDMKNTASNVFDYAISKEVIYRNPAKNVVIPSKAPVTERRALTPAERQMIQDTPNPRAIGPDAKDEYGMQLPSMIMLHAGLRRGEVIPLTWDDVDLQKGTITVNKAIEFQDNEPVLKNHTKTEAGMRTVHMNFILTEYLKKVKAHRIAKIHGLVCPSVEGTMYSANAWRYAWGDYMQTLDIKYGYDEEKKNQSKRNIIRSELTINPFTPHCLRHTFGSMLYDAGIDIKTIQIEMGHSDIKTTMNRYVHVDTDHCAEQMKKMNEYLNVKQA